MENKRANRSGRVLLWQDNVHREAGFSPIAVSAAISVIALFAVLGWQITRTTQAENAVSAVEMYLDSRRDSSENLLAGTSTLSAGFVSATSSGPNDFSNVGSEALGQLVGTYVTLKNSGEYTPEQGDSVAGNIAAAMRAQVSYTPYEESAIKTDANTSYERILAYRNDLRIALEPLLLNTEPELDIFARYIDTKDKNNLAVLGEVAQRYRKAAENASRMTVPKDASGYHLGIENALLQFAVTLESLIKSADDPMATLALLRTYNDAERYVFTSFDALASYQKRKIP